MHRACEEPQKTGLNAIEKILCSLRRTNQFIGINTKIVFFKAY